MDLSFDEWFDLFVEQCQGLGYSGPIDKYSFEDEYLQGSTPEYSAEKFFDEMRDI